MPRYTYDLFEPINDRDKALERLLKDFAPLHMEAWEKRKRAKYKRDYDLNVTTFVAMWLNKNLKIFMAYDGDKSVGYLTGLTYRPMEYMATAFQVDDWYTNDSPVIEAGLFDYLHDALRLMGCDELLIPQDGQDELPQIGDAWEKASETRLVRFVRK